MFFWLVIIIGIICVIGFVIAESNYIDWLSIVFIVMCVMCIVVTVVSLFIFVGEYSHARFQKIEYQQRYEGLMYQAKEYCKDDFGITNIEVIKDIKSWNCDLAYRKAVQRDFWFGIYWANIYDDFKMIDYNTIRYNNE